jgi:alkane 1-monooxygenase
MFSDPSTGRRGESFYAFVPRLFGGTLKNSFYYEARRLERVGKPPWSWRNRMLRGETWSIAILIAFTAVAGFPGAVGFLISAAIGKILLAAISYSQHYGLVRVVGAPFEARHAWDCYRPISDALLYNLPRHSDHHLHAGKIYCELGTTSEAPKLPYGYQTMALIALVPSLWSQIMNPLLADWDRRLASEAEQRLLHERGWTSETVSIHV